MILHAVIWLALAHTGIAQSLSVNLRPGVDSEVLVSTTFGAVMSKDKGATWNVVCEEAIGYGTGQRPAWLLSPTGATFAGSFRGLFVSRGDPCFWQSVTGTQTDAGADFEATGCMDLQGKAGTLLATTGKYGVENRILRSTDDGATWTSSPETSLSLFYSSVRFAPSSPQRVYAAAWWFSPYTSVLLRSDDNGKTFTRKDLSSALPAAGAFYVLGVHPLKPEVVYATVFKDDEPKTGWLLKSVDSGETFAPILTSTELFTSVAFGADPATVYAASGNNLYRSVNDGQAFDRLPHPERNACVTTRGSEVYSCGLQELDGWAVGQLTGGDFSPLLKWSRITGPFTCPSPSLVESICVPVWPVVRATFPLETVDGGGASDAGVKDGGHGAGALNGGGCGCSGVGLGPWAELLGLVWVRHLRRPTRQRQRPVP